MKKKRVTWKLGDIGAVKEDLYYIDSDDVWHVDEEMFLTKQELLDMAGVIISKGTRFIYIKDPDYGNKIFQSVDEPMWEMHNPEFKKRLKKVKK